MNLKKIIFGFAFIITCHNVNAQISFAPLVEELMPAVVSISTDVSTTKDNPEVKNNLIYGNNQQEILGSGFILSADGYIVTNAHVITDASKISVIDYDNERFEAKLIGQDEKTDIALIKIETDKKLNSVVLGNSDTVRVGDWVLAIGNPFGLGNSVTVGIVSATSRDIGDDTYNDYLQTDASINQGNSGGPMFNISGEVIGINSAIFSATGNGIGVGFALPSNEVNRIVNQLKVNGEVTRGWLGLELKYSIINDDISGLIITSFLDEQLAKTNKLEVGDIILEVNDKDISGLKHFLQIVSKSAPDTDLELTLWRNGQKITQNVRVGKMPNVQHSEEKRYIDDKGEYIPELGAYIYKNKIIKFDEISDLKRNGVAIGDEIFKMNGNNVNDIEAFKSYVLMAKLNNETLVIDLKDTKGNLYFVKLDF